MLREKLRAALRATVQRPVPNPGAGKTAERHRRLFEVGRTDLSLARLAEAHWDALAILAEAGHEADSMALYAAWASEKPGRQVLLKKDGDGFYLSGEKMFCTGAGFVDRALVTVHAPDNQLVDLDLNLNSNVVRFDESAWKTNAFRETGTATAIFCHAPVSWTNFIREPDWYSRRPGFWHGACGPAACWAGGAAGILDYAIQQARYDPHTLSHLGAMHASVWGLTSYLDSAGEEIDATPNDAHLARIRALTLRHLVEQACTDVIRRLPRAYGPHPLALDETISRRYQELDLYLRQSHAERDLESLGRAVSN